MANNNSVINKILLVYHSGSGSTRMVGSVIADKLKHSYDIDTKQIRPGFDYKIILEYDLVVLGFPTYYFRPSLSAVEFVKNLPELNGKGFFLYTTYGLYSGNSIRILSDALKEKNGRITGYAQIRGPASDGILIFPSIKLFFRYERKTDKKINRAIDDIKRYFQPGKEKENIPWMRWYSVLTWMFKRQLGRIDYSHYRSNLRVLGERCTNCDICIKNCIRGSWVEGEKHPSINTGDCEFCLKCVHNCPEKAIIFSDTMADRPRLDKKYYQEQKDIFLNKDLNDY
jgi:flavodoxin/NAD-dependent dihydropyrimidine dehydrogenase PreA subunit